MNDIIRLAGVVYTIRGAKDRPPDDLIAEYATHGDLTPEQAMTFGQCLTHPVLKAIIDLWWKAYDLLRELGVIDKAAPWWP